MMTSVTTFIFLLVIAAMLFGQPIDNYDFRFGWGCCCDSAEEVVVLREFERNDRWYYFTVSPTSLETAVYSTDSFSIDTASWEMIRNRYCWTPYIRALQRAEQFGDTMRDAGIRKLNLLKSGIDLTIDLCPSSHPLDRIVFTSLIGEVGCDKPVNIAISITGKWMTTHQDDLRWLDSLATAGELHIVWINHSYSHFIKKDAPLTSNFMLSPDIDVNSEVLKTESALLRKKIMPSIFFRFPGLVSDRAVFKMITHMGLIPVGSDAWLAKGQSPQNGSIVLIHANGNDTIGVHDFIRLLSEKRIDMLSNQWKLLDLRESIVDDEAQ